MTQDTRTLKVNKQPRKFSLIEKDGNHVYVQDAKGKRQWMELGKWEKAKIK